MKRKILGLFFIGIFIFLITSCSTNKTPKLENVIKTLSIKQNNSKVSSDFYVPKVMEHEKDYYSISWTTESSVIQIIEEEQLVFVDIHFDELDTGTHSETIIATISQGKDTASKSFTILLDKPTVDNPGGNTGGEDNPGGNIGGEDNPGGNTGGEDNPGGNTGGEDNPGGNTSAGNVSFSKKEFDNRLCKDGPLTEHALPSIGTPKMLVIPVNLNSSEATPKNLKEIKTAFIGSQESTGWESVQSYYQKSSYGKLNMDVTVLNQWFTPSKSASYYESYSSEDADGSTLILQEALTYYNKYIDFNDYDYNQDGYIDGVWLIYNYAVDFENSDSLFWAFTNWNYNEDEYDGVKSYYYAWAGIDFMHPTKDEANYYDPSDIKIDAHTFIHETGHMLGLDDYYDYDEKTGCNSYGFYGCDMMDYNIGDHSAISKLLLGWVSPTLATGTGAGTIDLKSFTTSGEFIIVADHTLSSIYDTYWIIEFYTNDGLNSHDRPYDSDTMDYGIRILEIHAEKNIVNGKVTDNSGTYQTGFKYDNSDEDKMFVDVIYEKNPTEFNEFSIDADCLYQKDETMKKTGLPFELVINSLTEEKANITITIK